LLDIPIIYPQIMQIKTADLRGIMSEFCVTNQRRFAGNKEGT